MKKTIPLNKPLPPWIREKLVRKKLAEPLRKKLRQFSLHTVCEEAKCPNIGECLGRGTATFLILGDVCTRNCGFCAIKKGNPPPPDPEEPERLRKFVEELGIRYAVVTSVTRDDLPDGGAGHFKKTIEELKKIPVRVEVLVPDFQGKKECLDMVLSAGPDVFNHNVETVPSLYSRVRPLADFRRSLSILEYAKRNFPHILTKSGFMVGLGEKKEEVFSLLSELAGCGVDMVTIGQYIRPSRNHLPVERYVHPDEFKEYEEYAGKAGIKWVVAGPLVRSSYMAEEGYAELMGDINDAC
ncbi:lipoyl synthase [bacterium]|nr:MAG: lipoyl synthase [bacterium]